jgi:threonine/homoserine/homoserine lactone efflux protein
MDITHMDTLTLFLNSMVIGLSIAAPVGPIGVLCIRRTLAEGRLIGFVSGMGAATADATYGLIAALGLTAFTSLLVDSAEVLRIVGGVFMLYLGYRTLTSRPPEKESVDKNKRSGWLSAYLSIFFLTVTNPMTILSFVGIFAGISGSSAARTPASSAVIVLGIFAGSALWWLILSGGVSLFRERVTPTWMLWINRFSGVIIVLFALRILLIGE